MREEGVSRTRRCGFGLDRCQHHVGGGNRLFMQPRQLRCTSCRRSPVAFRVRWRRDSELHESVLPEALAARRCNLRSCSRSRARNLAGFDGAPGEALHALHEGGGMAVADPQERRRVSAEIPGQGWIGGTSGHGRWLSSLISKAGSCTVTINRSLDQYKLGGAVASRRV
jgi:hypothetical protein